MSLLRTPLPVVLRRSHVQQIAKPLLVGSSSRFSIIGSSSGSIGRRHSSSSTAAGSGSSGGTSSGAGHVVNLSTLDAVEKFVQLHSKCCLYYTAVWCGPCRMIQPVYAEMAKKSNSSKVAFGKIDVDDNPEAAAAASIRAVPTFILYHNQEGVHSFSGADTQQLQTAVDDLQGRP